MKALLILCATAWAMTGRMIKVQGFVVSRDKSKVVIKDEKGPMNLPAAAVDSAHVKVGEWTVATVDFVDFFRLNPDKFKTSKTR